MVCTVLDILELRPKIRQMIGRYLDYSDKKFIEVGSLIIFTECPVRTSILGHSILIFDSIIVTGLNKGMENPHNEVV